MAANELEEVAQNWVRQNIHPKLGFINWTNGTASLVALINKQRQEAVVSVLKDLVSIEYPPSGKQYHFRDGSWSNTLAWVAGHLKELESKEEASE